MSALITAALTTDDRYGVPQTKDAAACKPWSCSYGCGIACVHVTGVSHEHHFTALLSATAAVPGLPTQAVPL